MDELKKYGIHHVGLVVPDLDATVQHWKDYYGVTDFKYWTFNPMKAWVYGQPVEEYKLNVAMGTIHPGGCNVEIISPITEYGYHYDFVKSGKTGLNHICFSTDNYEFNKSALSMKNAVHFYLKPKLKMILLDIDAVFTQKILLVTLYTKSEKFPISENNPKQKTLSIKDRVFYLRDSH